MTDEEAIELVKDLRKPCGETIGHGEICEDGWLCSNCRKKSKAAELITELAEMIVYLKRALEAIAGPIVHGTEEKDHEEFWSCSRLLMSPTMCSRQFKAKEALGHYSV